MGWGASVVAWWMNNRMIMVLSAAEIVAIQSLLSFWSFLYWSLNEFALFPFSCG